MIQFELRSVMNTDYYTQEVDGVMKVVFNITPIIGVKGNIYPSFLNMDNTILVYCDKDTMTGKQMDDKIYEEATLFVQNNFPPINN